MRVVSSLFLVLLGILSAEVFAIELAPLAPPNQERLPIDRDAPDVPCPQIVDRLVQYNEMARQHDQSVSAFLNEVVLKMGEWHSVLQPLEGQEQNLPMGTFSVLEDGAGKISLVSEKAYDNSELLANELDRIIVSLRSCVQKNRSFKLKKGR